jgi:hypothetical protein
MTDTLIPSDVLEFLLAHIDSIAELEALLLLRNNAGQPWTLTAMSKRLYIDEPLCSAVLSHLEAEGLCACKEGLYRYALSGAPEDGTVDRLAHTYAQYLIPVTNVIHGKPARIQKFADAFRVRKGK